jgi:hypothetical protein
MEHRRFDALTRSLASGLSRRRVMAGLAAGASSWFTPISNRAAAAQDESAAGADRCRGECRPPCPTGAVCEPDGCYCIPEWFKDRDRITLIERGGDLRVAEAYAPGNPGTLLHVTRGCEGQTCSAVLEFQEDGAAAPFFVAEAEISPDHTLSMRFVGSGVDYVTSVDPRTFDIETTAGGGDPVRDTYDPERCEFAGSGEGLTLPDALVDKLQPLQPALAAIAGEAALMSRPGRTPWGVCPTPDDPAATPNEICKGACSLVVEAGIGECCLATVGLGCLGCYALGVTIIGLCWKACDDSFPTASAAPQADATGIAGTQGSEPTATPTPTASASGAIGADSAGITGGVAAESPTPSPSPTPPSTSAPQSTELEAVTGPSACAAGELPCGGKCIPASECSGAGCCLDPASCQCICPDCSPPFVVDTATCGCVCGMTECSPNHVWDREACTCTCVQQPCPDHHVFDEALCTCVCGRDGCPPNYVFDEAGCACLCAAECPPTFVFDEAACSCLCELESCPPHLTFDPGSCACYCAPPACPPGFFVDRDSCSCVCVETACEEGQVFDAAACACVGSGAGSSVG